MRPWHSAGTDRTAAPDGVVRPLRRQVLAEHLLGIVADAEQELGRLGRHPKAWEHIRAHLMGTMPVFAYDPTVVSMLLGPLAPRNGRGDIPTRELPALRAIARQAKRCRRCQKHLANLHRLGLLPEACAESAMISRAKDHHFHLFRQYAQELKQGEQADPLVLRDEPAWAAAQRAATAAAVIEHLDSPMACFAAGAYLEQTRLLAWARQKLLPQANARVRRRFMEGITRGQFPALEEAAVGRARARAAKKERAERTIQEEPVRQAVRGEYRQLLETGVRPTPAMRRIVEDPDIRARIQLVARGFDVKPWHHDFYSFGAVRKIVGA
jgi:hypothetical protein